MAARIIHWYLTTSSSIMSFLPRLAWAGPGPPSRTSASLPSAQSLHPRLHNCPCHLHHHHHHHHRRVKLPSTGGYTLIPPNARHDSRLSI
ncbi:hypothetical protein JOL62DRAFT_307399 [Phyllosticta paracitricarpa]|uniref:Secreted protein n=1 Tax=Phyllosticta paracitricarpa TaxID=2016321 RepID=A0ABR1NGZ7_9PEZI